VGSGKWGVGSGEWKMEIGEWGVNSYKCKLFILKLII
jgi:hypothetical protein